MSLLGLFLATTVSAAVTEVAVQTTPPAALAVLRKWEEAATATKTVTVDLQLTVTDYLTKKARVSTGELTCRNVDRRLRLELKGKAREEESPFNLTLIRQGGKCHSYERPDKTETIYTIGGDSNWGEATCWPFGCLVFSFDFWFLDFVSGTMTARDFVRQYKVVLLDRQDDNYVYLDLTPRGRAISVRTEFKSVTVALYKPANSPPGLAFAPRTVVRYKGDGSQAERWDFTTARVNANVDDKVFAFPPTPNDWKVLRTEAFEQFPRPTPLPRTR